jgi:hypothetical protein
MEKCLGTKYPVVLGFSKVKDGKSNVFLIEAHAQFGDDTWRRALKHDGKWEIYWPAGGDTWNHSCVIVEPIYN